VATAFDALVFSGVWAAGVAAALVGASSYALAVSPRWDTVALAFTGALVVYPVDRLRDLERDRSRAPLRSEFVTRHRRLLSGLVSLAGLAAIALASRFGAGIWLLCAFVLGAGLLHRRLKRFGRGKAVYVSLAWASVVVGLPAIAQGPFPAIRVAWAAAVILAAVFSNLIASNLAETGRARFSPEAWPQVQGRRLALGSALLGSAVGLLGPVPVIAAVPVVQALALVRHREGERFTQGVVDGALLMGGLAACGLSWYLG
jgi:hypothetical protein